VAQGPQNDDALNLEENARIFFGFKNCRFLRSGRNDNKYSIFSLDPASLQHPADAAAQSSELDRGFRQFLIR
jgi:hypothetical protein